MRIMRICQPLFKKQFKHFFIGRDIVFYEKVVKFNVYEERLRRIEDSYTFGLIGKEHP